MGDPRGCPWDAIVMVDIAEVEKALGRNSVPTELGKRGKRALHQKMKKN